jgi:hypothetical protein
MTMTAPTVDQPDATEVSQPEHTGGMVALIPTEEDAAKLAVEGGDPVEQLHLTLAFLGEDVTDWDPEIAAAVHEVARRFTDPTVEQDDDQPVPESYDGRGPGQRGPLTLTIFAHSHFNPNGGPDGQEPCMVYQFGDSEDLKRVDALHSDVCWQVKEAIGEVNFSEQHAPYKPHLTAGYNLPPDALTYTGPVVFDRLRVALADEVTDYPLGGSGVISAAATPPRRSSDGKSNRVYIDVRASAGDDNDLSRFIQLCKTIEYLSSVGASRDIRVPVDGDGSASLKFDFGDTDVNDVEVPDIDDEIVIGMGN